MNLENIIKGMLNLQDTFLQHSFYVADFFLEQTGTGVTLMGRRLWNEDAELKPVSVLCEYSRTVNRRIQTFWNQNLRVINRIMD